jgi:PiT family inorganic phosphate transporter
LLLGLDSVVLIAIAVAFAWSMGAHYTGATMGMSYASHSIRAWPALGLMAILALLGATFASHGVELNLGKGVVAASSATVAFAIIIVASGFLLTTALTYVKVPSSTIQILVFAVVGTALAAGLRVNWGLIGSFVVVWALAPVVACGLGFVLTKLMDLFLPGGKIRRDEMENMQPPAIQHDERLSRVTNISVLAVGTRFVSGILVLFGAAASFTMGANDVSNASGVFLMTNTFGVLEAGFIGGIGLAIGALTWGRRLLNRVAFDIVKLDLNMASAAQFAQALVVFVPVVAFGYFTSMNQALVGAMAGAGFARGRQTVQRGTVTGILEGWAIVPISSLVFAFLVAKVVEVAAPALL